MKRLTPYGTRVLTAVGCLLALVGCNSGDPVSVTTTPLTITARLTAVSDAAPAASAPAAPAAPAASAPTAASYAAAPSRSTPATATGAGAPTSVGAAPTSNAPAPAPDPGNADIPPAIQALYACLRAHGIALDANGQPEATGASYNPGPAQKAFTECSASIIAQQSAGH